jgi:hypothetical protein
MSIFVPTPKSPAGWYEWLRRISLRAGNKMLYFSDSSVGNSAGALTTLHTTELPLYPNGYFWNGTGQYVRVTTRGTFAANANTKDYAIYCGLAACPFSLAINSGSFYAQCEFWKPDVSTLSARGVLWTTNASFPVRMSGLGYAAAGVRVGEGAQVYSEGGTVGASDVVENFFRVEWFPSVEQF